MELFIAAIFLPLFPLSALFNFLSSKVDDFRFRIVLIILWPLCGVAILASSTTEIPDWVFSWSIASALLYAFRSLVLKDLKRWNIYMSISAFSLIWIGFSADNSFNVWLTAFAFIVPFLFSCWVIHQVFIRFGGTYAGPIHSLATDMPHLSSLLIFSVLAIIATPIFPGFFSMIGLTQLTLQLPLFTTIGILCTWLIWTWSGIRLIQGFIVGHGSKPSLNERIDVAESTTIATLIPMILFILAGLVLSGEML